MSKGGTNTNSKRVIAQHLKDSKFFLALGVASEDLNHLGAAYETYAQLAQCEMILGFYERANQSWKAAMQFEETAQAHLGIGIIWFQKGDTLKAICAFKAAHIIDRKNAEVLDSLSAAHLHINKPIAARYYANLALKICSERLESLLFRARAEIALGNHKLVREDIDFLKLRGYKANEVRLLEVDLLVENEEYDSAIFLASQLCEKYPESNTCLDVFRKAYLAFYESDRREEFFSFLEALEHFIPLPIKRDLVCSACIPKEVIDVIIPVHNGWSLLKRCFDSVRTLSGPCLGRIILVNDCSDYATRLKLKHLVDTEENVVLIETSKQSGFSRALALGLNESTSTTFVALNSDTLVTEGWLDRLYTRLRSAKLVAMVGPLSNSAGWQNYGPVLSAKKGFASSAIPTAQLRADLNEEIIKKDYCIQVHMLHGFCVLVDRKIYNNHGGLDQILFPEGYGEFQDLSIRMRESGHVLLLAADCLVFHEKGGSISSSRRAFLSMAGRKALYEKYSAINYLCLEMASIQNSALMQYRKALFPTLEELGALTC